MKLSELIQIFRSRQNLSLEEIGDFVSVSKSTVSRWERGEIKNISSEKKDRLSELFCIDVQDYLDHYFFKPILGDVRAGYDLLAYQDISGYEVVSKQEYDSGDYFLRVQGDSMTGSRINDGDLIYVQKSNVVNSGEIAVVMLENDEVTVKKVIYKDHLMILEATNPEYETRYFTEEEILNLPVQILGKVLKVRVNFN
ncbi:MAG: S24 family peptidase [Erysipelothrix sp.]